MNDTLRTIANRKSIRAYRDTAIPEDRKNAVLEATLRAPTAGNLMLYSIVDIDDPAIKETLAKSCDNQPFIATAPWLLLFLADYRRWMDLYETGNAFSLEDAKHRKPGLAELMLACSDALIAAQTAVVAAESLGIGSCYIGDIMENFEIHRETLRLPRYTFPVALLCFGYPIAERKEKTPRMAQTVVVHKNTYKPLNPEESLSLIEALGKERMPHGYPEGSANFAQYTYKRKLTANFSFEMERSVEKWIKDWCGCAEE